MRTEKGSVRHYGHTQRDPEEEGGQQASPAVVLCVVFERVLNDANVDEAADEEEEDGEVVRTPEEGHAFVVEVHALFLFGPGKKFIFMKIKSIWTILLHRGFREIENLVENFEILLPDFTNYVWAG